MCSEILFFFFSFPSPQTWTIGTAHLSALRGGAPLYCSARPSTRERTIARHVATWTQTELRTAGGQQRHLTLVFMVVVRPAGEGCDHQHCQHTTEPAAAGDQHLYPPDNYESGWGDQLFYSVKIFPWNLVITVLWSDCNKVLLKIHWIQAVTIRSMWNTSEQHQRRGRIVEKKERERNKKK